VGAVRVKTLNDRLLQTDYADPEEVKSIISNWGMMEKLAEGGDTVASAILVDLQRAIGVSITDFGENKKAGFDTSHIERGVLTEAQFISLVYVLGLGYRQDEIAYVLGCKKQTVNIHIQRALNRVCKYLEGKVKDEKNKKKR
jgi:DNA-binding NarL/FixJ family response regulator